MAKRRMFVGMDVQKESLDISVDLAHLPDHARVSADVDRFLHQNAVP